MNPFRALLAISLGCASGVVLAQSRPVPLAAVVGRFCVACHNSRLAEGGVSFDALDAEHPWAAPDTWERVLRQLRAGTMPPTDTPRPDRKTYDALVAWLASALDPGDARKTAAPARRLTDREWASRLASLLWSAAPDAALVDAARRRRLQDSAGLEGQVRRMLADPKTAGLVDGFFDAWLGLDQLSTMRTDAAAFPEFDAELRQAMRRETELFLESQLREDRPAVELWTANYSYLNDRLARHYGIPNVAGAEFRRVALPGTGRAGLLGQGSFLTLTSILTRHAAVDAPSTSPAARGKWIRQHFLGVPAPNPIPNIPPQQKGILLSRQLRALPDPSCNACHSNFFPLGYALENLDPLGRWRAEAQGEPIDVSGALVDGTEFEGPAEMRALLLERRDAFLTTITERLLAYAMDGKPGIFQQTPAARMPAVRAALREAASKDYTWSSLLAAIARSVPFREPAP